MRLEPTKDGNFIIEFKSRQNYYKQERKGLLEEGAKNWTVRRLDPDEVDQVLQLRKQITHVKIHLIDPRGPGNTESFTRRLVPDGISDVTNVMAPEDRDPKYRIFGFTWVA